MIRVEKQCVQPDAEDGVVRMMLPDGILDLLFQGVVGSLERRIHRDADDLFRIWRQFR